MCRTYPDAYDCPTAHLGRTVRLIDCDAVQPPSLRAFWQAGVCHDNR